MRLPFYWRNDDPSIITKLYKFQFVHEIFQKFGVIHTVALIMKDIEKNEPLVNYILSNKSEFNIQLHCWEHFDHSKDFNQAKESILKGAEAIKSIFGTEATIFFPPWNLCTPDLSDFCRLEGITAKPEKVSIEQYIRFNGDVEEDCCNFHYWYEPEVNDLYRALEIYTR